MSGRTTTHNIILPFVYSPLLHYIKALLQKGGHVKKWQFHKMVKNVNSLKCANHKMSKKLKYTK